jgi:hypothetical protein
MPTSPSAPNFQFTDYAQQLQNIERRRQLAQALFSQGLEPTATQPAVGGIVTPISPMAGLAQMAKLGVGAYGMAQAEKKTEEVSKQRQMDLANNLRAMGIPDQQIPSTVQMLNMPETAGMAQNRIALQLAKNVLPQGNPMNPNSANPSVMAGQGTFQGTGGAMMPPAPMDLLAAGPVGNELYKAINEQNKLLNVRPEGSVFQPGQGFIATAPKGGTQITWGPNGPQQNLLPGATGAIQAINQAEAAGRGVGEAQTQLQPVLTPDNRTIYPSRAQLLGLPPVGSPQTPTTPQSNPSANPSQLPSYYRAGGFGQSTAERAAAEANEKQLAEEAAKGREAADAAVDMRFNLQQLLEHSKEFETGKFTPSIMNVRSYLQSMAPNLFPESEMNKLANFQDLNKYSKRLGFDMARKMGARESTQIVQMSIDANPNPEMVRPAIDAISHGLLAQTDYITAREQAREAWRDEHRGTLSGFNSNWLKISDPRAFLLKYQTPQAIVTSRGCCRSCKR